LLLAATVYIAIGDLGEGITLAFFVLAVLGLTFYQEGKSENSIEALKDLNQPFARVFRDSNVTSIPTKHIVREDIILISEGDRIPADGNLIEADDLEVDESLLTGESLSVLKNFQSDLKQETLVYSGTFVIRGQGLFKVSATGIHTEIGKIGHSLNRIQAEETPLHKQTARLVKVIASIGLALCAMMIIVLGLRTGEWVPALLSGIALAMAMLPEEYPVVLAIFPALGAHRLAKQGVLVRHIDTIETLGATTILCTDKTGTLTQNQMAVQALVIQKTESLQLNKFLAVDNTALPNAFHPLIKNSILASIPIPFDPMEIAFHRFGEKWLGNLLSTQYDWELVKTYPLNPGLRAMSQVWKVSNDGGFVIAAKGSPEAVFDLCHMSAEEVDIWKNAVDELALQGLRVLAIAEVQQVSSHWPE
jgi:Ca2+-transporting ATPase